MFQLSPDAQLMCVYMYTQAAEDARQQMGNRVFYDQMLTDACQQQQLRVGSEVDVTNMKEYMQVLYMLQSTRNINSLII